MSVYRVLAALTKNSIKESQKSLSLYHVLASLTKAAYKRLTKVRASVPCTCILNKNDTIETQLKSVSIYSALDIDQDCPAGWIMSKHKSNCFILNKGVDKHRTHKQQESNGKD